MDGKEKITNPEKVAVSAEKQLLALKRAEEGKIEQVKQERNKMVALRRTLSALIYAAGSGYLSVYPQAEGFIEGRIKTLDSIEIKTRNEITEILSQIEENPDIDQQEILRKISEIDFKDLFAFSVVTTETPEHFKTGSDEKNAEFTNLSTEITTAKKRIVEHQDFCQTNDVVVLKLTNIMTSLREKESGAISEAERDDEISARRQEILDRAGELTKEELARLFDESIAIAKADSKERIQADIANAQEFLDNAKSNQEYGQSNLSRTKDVLMKALRDLQYKMSEYYVSNLSKFSIFKFWGTTPIRAPKPMNKPGFRAVNTGFKVQFTSPDGEGTTLKFEAQGKGGLDYEDAEFSVKGATYHEEQKTKDGIISKNIEMPDFTIIGSDLTNKIEREVRTKYSDVTSIEDFEELGMTEAIEELRAYEQRFSEEMQKESGTNRLTKKIVKKRMAQAFADSKEFYIQKEIEQRIAECVSIMADGRALAEKISQREEYKAIFEDEYAKIKASKPDASEEEISHLARVRVLYRLKEIEIMKYAETSIPKFFRANLPKKEDAKEEISVYWFTPGESVYRFFINRLNGLKDEDGKYKYEPQEQQKRALFRLTGLFEENTDNFYTYNIEGNSFGTIQNIEDNGVR